MELVFDIFSNDKRVKVRDERVELQDKVIRTRGGGVLGI